MMTPYVVTRYYRAPEVILGMGYKENGRDASETMKKMSAGFRESGVYVFFHIYKISKIELPRFHIQSLFFKLLL
jgi:hypothetical protein